MGGRLNKRGYTNAAIDPTFATLGLLFPELSQFMRPTSFSRHSWKDTVSRRCPPVVTQGSADLANSYAF